MFHACQQHYVDNRPHPAVKVTRRTCCNHAGSNARYLVNHTSTDLRGLAPDGAPRPFRGVIILSNNIGDACGEIESLRMLCGPTSGLETCSCATGEVLTYASLGYLPTDKLLTKRGRCELTTILHEGPGLGESPRKQLVVPHCKRKQGVFETGTHTRTFLSHHVPDMLNLAQWSAQLLLYLLRRAEHRRRQSRNNLLWGRPCVRP